MMKMTELKRMFEMMGFNKVQTYINSGNVLFESPEGEESLLQKIELEIQNVFGLSIQVVLRTCEELRGMIDACPYRADVANDGKNVNIGLLNEVPSQERIDQLGIYKGIDDFQIIGREIHLLFRQSVADSKLANHLPKLGGTVTVRNWNTINKLATLADALEN